MPGMAMMLAATSTSKRHALRVRPTARRPPKDERPTAAMAGRIWRLHACTGASYRCRSFSAEELDAARHKGQKYTYASPEDKFRAMSLTVGVKRSRQPKRKPGKELEQ